MEKGYILTLGNKELFFVTDKKIICNSVVRAFIDKICDIKGHTDSTRELAKNDAYTLQNIKRRIDRATLELRETQYTKYYSINGENFAINIPFSEKDCLFIFSETGV